MKILLVDDARSIREFMKSRLTNFGHEVITAENGQAAVDLMAETLPDLVLMDIEMPVMNGFGAAHCIRAMEATQKWAWTPIIFLTASDTVDNLVTAIEAGGDDFMAKSSPEPVLQAKMKAMARIATLRQRLSIANRVLEDLASRDGLTGLCNRYSLDVRGERLWEQSKEQGKPFAVLMIDVDNFKKYNDRYGHLAGDEALRKVADAIANVVEQCNATGETIDAFPARYGGEEFAVVLPHIGHATCANIATRVLEAVRALSIAHDLNANFGVVTASIGGHQQDAATGELSTAFRTADQSLYRAKQCGRNRVEM